MTSIANSSVVEDQYIAHLAGMPAGKMIIGFGDGFKSYSAQKHPIANSISASIIGLIGSGVLTTVGVLAYPLANSSMRESILGSALVNICGACKTNAEALTKLFCDVQRIIEPDKAALNCGRTIESYEFGLEAGSKCPADDQFVPQCRIINYHGGVWNTVSDNYVLIGAVAVSLASLATWFIYSQMNSYARKESQAEESIKQSLTDRFGKIASRLTALEANQEIQECANNILQRRVEINKEIEDLQLPALTWKDIEQITQPVFDAATTLQQKNNPQTV